MATLRPARGVQDFQTGSRPEPQAEDTGTEKVQEFKIPTRGVLKFQTGPRPEPQSEDPATEKVQEFWFPTRGVQDFKTVPPGAAARRPRN